MYAPNHRFGTVGAGLAAWLSLTAIALSLGSVTATLLRGLAPPFCLLPRLKVPVVHFQGLSGTQITPERIQHRSWLRTHQPVSQLDASQPLAPRPRKVPSAPLSRPRAPHTTKWVELRSWLGTNQQRFFRALISLLPEKSTVGKLSSGWQATKNHHY